MTISRRSLLQGAAGSLALLGAPKVFARQRDMLDVTFTYRTILGDDPVEDAGFKGQNFSETEYQQLASSHDLSGDAAVWENKSKRVSLPIDQNEAYSSTGPSSVYNCELYWIISEDFRANIVKRDSTLNTLVQRVAGKYSSPEAQAQALLCFVQTAIEYERERLESEDPLRSPKNVLLFKKGLCGDKSVLYASLLEQLRIPSLLLLYAGPDWAHVNVGVPLEFEKNRVAPESVHLDGKVNIEGKTYYVAETCTPCPVYLGKQRLTLQRVGICGIL